MQSAPVVVLTRKKRERKARELGKGGETADAQLPSMETRGQSSNLSKHDFKRAKWQCTSGRMAGLEPPISRWILWFAGGRIGGSCFQARGEARAVNSQSASDAALVAASRERALARARLGRELSLRAALRADGRLLELRRLGCRVDDRAVGVRAADRRALHREDEE